MCQFATSYPQGWDLEFSSITGSLVSRTAKENPIKCFTRAIQLTIRDTRAAGSGLWDAKRWRGVVDSFVVMSRCPDGGGWCWGAAGVVVRGPGLRIETLRWMDRAGDEEVSICKRAVDRRGQVWNGNQWYRVCSARLATTRRAGRWKCCSRVVPLSTSTTSCLKEVHRGLMGAASLGTYFNKEIKPVYEHHRIAEPYDQPKPRPRIRGGSRPRSRKRR